MNYFYKIGQTTALQELGLQTPNVPAPASTPAAIPNQPGRGTPVGNAPQPQKAVPATSQPPGPAPAAAPGPASPFRQPMLPTPFRTPPNALPVKAPDGSQSMRA